MADTAPRPGPAAEDRRLGAAAVSAVCFAALGLAASGYLTVEHFTASATLACPETGTINCAKVTTSAWSQLAGIPVAVLGLAYFAVMTALTAPPAIHRRALDRTRVVAAGAGVAMVVYLIWAELFRVNAICLWCTAVHISALALFTATAWHAAARADPQPEVNHQRAPAGRDAAIAGPDQTA